MTSTTAGRLTGNHPEWCFTRGRCIHLDAPTDRAWAADVEPYMVDVDGSLSRFLRTCPAVLDEETPMSVFIEEFECTTSGGSEAPTIVLDAKPHECGRRLMGADEARALASALVEHADQLEAIEAAR